MTHSTKKLVPVQRRFMLQCRHGYVTPALEELAAEAQEAEEQRKADAFHYLEDVEKRIQPLGVATSIAVVFGLPADQILDYSQEHKMDLIAMSSHGRTGIGRWIFGSVTDKLLHAGTVPVLVARAPAA